MAIQQPRSQPRSLQHIGHPPALTLIEQTLEGDGFGRGGGQLLQIFPQHFGTATLGPIGQQTLDAGALQERFEADQRLGMGLQKGGVMGPGLQCIAAEGRIDLLVQGTALGAQHFTDGGHANTSW